MGVIQATNSGLVKGYAKVIGVFPWVGTPFRKSGEAVDEANQKAPIEEKDIEDVINEAQPKLGIQDIRNIDATKIRKVK